MTLQPYGVIPPTPYMITLSSRVALGEELQAYGGFSAQAVTANRAYIYPVYLEEPTTIAKAYVGTATASGNVDIGLFDSGFAKLLSTGATAMSGVPQVIDVTDTAFGPGLYYFACSFSATPNIRCLTASVAFLKAAGFLMESTAHPLPATLTPVVAAEALMPQFGFTIRSTP